MKSANLNDSKSHRPIIDMKNLPFSRVANQGHRYSEVIYDLTRTIHLSNTPADRVLRKYFREHKKFGASDRRFISETVYALFRWWGWLRLLLESEEEIWQHHSGGIAANPDWLSVLLGANMLGTTELHPVVIYWKDLLHQKKGLPKFIDGLGNKPLPDRAQYLSHFFGKMVKDWKNLVPGWFIKELQLANADLFQVIEILQKRPPLWLRIQANDIPAVVEQLQLDGLHVEQSPLVKNALSVSNPRVNLYALPLFRAGKFEVQDLASQTIGIGCGAKPGERWWDVCAGAGGKSLQLASMMKNKGLVVATDIRSWKLADLRKRAKRSRLFNITSRMWDGKGIPAKAANFDGVLVDAPCSGTGTWRRNPDGRWNLKFDELMTLAGLQHEILTVAAKAVKPGGVLVYATCSMCVCENEELVEGFLKLNSEYSLEPLVHPLTGERLNGMFRVWPQFADSDAVFVAKMKRKA